MAERLNTLPNIVKRVNELIKQSQQADTAVPQERAVLSVIAREVINDLPETGALAQLEDALKHMYYLGQMNKFSNLN